MHRRGELPFAVLRGPQPPVLCNADGLIIAKLSVTLPVKVISEANAMTRRGAPGHWREKLKRKHLQQQEVMVELKNAMMERKFEFPVLVTLTRIGSKKLDKDNLANSFKAVQDQIAASLGVDDGNESKIDWKYQQEVTGKRQYAIRIDIQPRVLSQLNGFAQ